jgi:hypothetical protein
MEPEGVNHLETLDVPPWVRTDPEWAAALHLLTSPALRNKGCLAAVDFDRQRIDFPGLAERARPWSHGERILLCTAWALFNGGDHRAFAALLDGELLAEAVTTLDTGNLRRLLEGTRLRRPDLRQG